MVEATQTVANILSVADAGALHSATALAPAAASEFASSFGSVVDDITQRHMTSLKLHKFKL